MILYLCQEHGTIISVTVDPLQYFLIDVGMHVTVGGSLLGLTGR